MIGRIGSISAAFWWRGQIGRAEEDLSIATQRLASGERIVRPGDDPAGNAIATQLNTETRIYAQGIRNLNEGISAVSIAEAAMGEL